MAIGLDDLKKHLIPQAKVEPLHVIAPQAKPTIFEVGREARDAGDREPQIYSVRKLLQKAEQNLEENNGAPAESEPPATAAGLTDVVLSYVGQNVSKEYQVFQAVARVFDQTAGPCEQLGGLEAMYEPVEALGQTVASVFSQLENFRHQLVQLAQTYEPVKVFHLQVTQLAQSFEAVKPLQQQITQLTEAFQLHLAALVKALEPAEELRLRILQLAEAFEPLTTLHEKFSQLADAFDVTPVESAAGERNTEVPTTGSAVMFYVDKSS